MVVALLCILGCIVGSFLNVVIVRTHDDLSLLRPRSHCPHCKHPLGVRDLIPLISYLVQRGRCRYCRTAISFQYPLVELATGLLFALLYLKHSNAFPFIAGNALSLYARDVVIGCFLILIFVYDLRYQLIPDWFVVPPILIAFFWNTMLGKSVLGLLVAGATISGIFFLQYILSRGRWIGLGDALIGCLIGVYLGLSHGLVAVWFAYVGGALIALGMLTVKKAGVNTPVPLGSYLVAATLFTVFYGDMVVSLVNGVLG